MIYGSTKADKIVHKCCDYDESIGYRKTVIPKNYHLVAD